jgi:hypothetical protein
MLPMMLLSLVGMFFGSIAASLGMAGLWGLTAHGLLRVSGGCAHGLGRTFQAICYGSGANMLSAVPCVGAYVGWIWWAVSAVLMLKEGQCVSGRRASVAVLALPCALALLVLGLYAWTIAAAMAA